ncbi:TerD family protein [Williamsia sp. CHRR-6]|uniref:TerD family protein n=1 Tax=Williamsia sp. CHRR-6 TaxID=2835871 RepID=UPI001BDB0592|nr:TerD family protein [Williamsia sp. CHRR-6]MBT0566233.1 TerD family protein [Williamsia sp. CHRR-6]
MESLARGQNCPIEASALVASVAGVMPGSVDLLVFQVSEAGRVRSDADLVFFNNPTSPEGAVRLTGPAEVSVDLGQVPADVATLRLAVTLDDSVPGNLAGIAGLGVVVGSVSAPAVGLTSERSAVLVEIYRRGGAWKLRNVSEGWDGGLDRLVTEHGVSVDQSAPAPTPPAPTPPAPTPPAPTPPAPTPPAPTPTAPTPSAAPAINLSKITLTKTNPTISLAKSANRPSGHMRVNLNWARGKSGGLFRKASKPVDLDIGCLYELTDGSKGIVQALGNRFGSLDAPPYVFLDGDDRTGTAVGGENLLINLAHLDQFTRLLVFAHIYEGIPNWSAADAVVTMHPPNAGEVEVRLDSPDDSAYSCAIALLQVVNGELTVTRQVNYIQGSQSAIDAAYGWGLKWTSGRK